MARRSDPHATVALLRAAEEIFVERGLEAARVEDITTRARRSKGSFYLHFNSKEDAFRRIVEGILARLAQCIENEPPPGLEAIDVAALLDLWLERDVAIFEVIWHNRSVARLILQGGGSVRFQYLVDAFAERARTSLKAWLAWGQARGVYPADLDLELASLVMSGAYDRVARELVRLEKKPDLEAWLRDVQEMLLGGVASDEVREVLAGRKQRQENARPKNDRAVRPVVSGKKRQSRGKR